MFVLFGELLECMGHHFLEWYGEKKIKYWQGEREKCFANKDKPGIRRAPQMAIYWREYLRSLQGILYNFFDEIVVESPRDRYVRCQCSSTSECSSPTYWQKVHHGDNLDLSDEDFVADYMSVRESILQRVRDARELRWKVTQNECTATRISLTQSPHFDVISDVGGMAMTE